MVKIPPRSETIIQGMMVKSTLENDRLCMIEPSDTFLKKGSVMVDNRNTVPVHLMNISDEMNCIYPGRNISVACSVAEVQTVRTQANSTESAVPSHLADLYQTTVEGVSGSQ